MATAPFPFFYNPPYAYPSAAAYPSLAPGYFPAPAYGSYNFASDATYHQPPPFFYSGPPAFPHATPYSYPPPAPAYGFSSIQQPPILASTPVPIEAEPNWPPSTPDPTTSTTYSLVGEPASVSSPYPQSPTTVVPPGPSIPPATSVFSSLPPAGRPTTALLGSPKKVLGAPLATDRSSPTPQLLDAIPAAPNRERCKTQRQLPPRRRTRVSPPQSANLYYSKSKASFHKSASNTQPDLESHLKLHDRDASPSNDDREMDAFQHHATDLVLDRFSSSIPSKNDDHEVTSYTPTSMPCFFSGTATAIGSDCSASSTPIGLAPSFGFGLNNTATTSGCATGSVMCGSSSPTPLFGNNTTSSPATTAAMALSTHSTGTVYAGPKVFGQMPTPRPGYEHYCDVHQNPNPIQSSSVHGGSTNLHEKYVDEVLQSYGFNNLISRSLFLADDDDTDGFSSEFVHVLSSTPDQQSYEAEQQDSEQLLKCVGKALKAEQTIVCLNYSSHLFDCTLAQQQQNDEKASLNVQQPRESHWNVLVIHERRNGWDPGIHTFFSSTQTSDIHYFHQTSILPKSGIPLLNGVLAARIQLGISKCFVPRQCNYRVPSRLMNPGIHFLWDPGILNQLDIMPEETAVPNLLRNGQKKFKLLIFIGKHVGSKQFWAQLLLHCHSWCTTPSVFLRVQSCCLSIILDYLYSEPVKQLVCYCSIFNWTVVSLSTIVHMRLVLSAGKIVQGRDVWDPGAATFHVRFMTADDATKLQCIDVYKSAMIQILAVKLGARNAPIFATAIMCFVAFDLRWTEMNAAAVLVQVVPYSKDTSRGS